MIMPTVSLVIKLRTSKAQEPSVMPTTTTVNLWRMRGSALHVLSAEFWIYGGRMITWQQTHPVW